MKGCFHVMENDLEEEKGNPESAWLFAADADIIESLERRLAFESWADGRERR